MLYCNAGMPWRKVAPFVVRTGKPILLLNFNILGCLECMESMKMTQTSFAHHLSQLAALPLNAERQKMAAQVLEAWLPGANALSEKMSASCYQTLLPATVFVQNVTVVDEV